MQDKIFADQGYSVKNAKMLHLENYLYLTAALDPLTSLEVSCVAREDGCYLEASCVPSQPGRVSGCRLDYTSSAGSASRNVTQFNTNVMVTAVLCDNQTFSYTGTAYDAMLRPLECIRNSTTKCPLLKGNAILSLLNFS